MAGFLSSWRCFESTFSGWRIWLGLVHGEWRTHAWQNEGAYDIVNLEILISVHLQFHFNQRPCFLFFLYFNVGIYYFLMICYVLFHFLNLQFVSELARVAAPGATIIIVTWCHRILSPSEESLSPDEKNLLDRICDAYYLPAWCSASDYVKLLESLSLQVILYF